MAGPQAPRRPRWNAIELLELTNTAKNDTTCVANVASGGRCQNIVTQDKLHRAREILDSLPQLQLTPYTADQHNHLWIQLEALSRTLVCHHQSHLQQSHDITRRWCLRIRDQVIRPTLVQQAHARQQRPLRQATAEADECSICITAFVDPIETPCGHTFCRGCLNTWFAATGHETCPMDRTELAWDWQGQLVLRPPQSRMEWWLVTLLWLLVAALVWYFLCDTAGSATLAVSVHVQDRRGCLHHGLDHVQACRGFAASILVKGIRCDTEVSRRRYTVVCCMTRDWCRRKIDPEHGSDVQFQIEKQRLA